MSIVRICKKWYIVFMKKTLIKKLSTSMKKAEKKLSVLTHSQKKALEKSWDIEHAYYSSALEGSRVGRKEFEKLGERVA